MTRPLPQQTFPAKQFLGPLAEDIAARFADDETEVFQQATDRVLKITLDLHQQGPTVQDSPDLMACDALYLNFPVPAALHDSGQACGIIAVALIDLHRQRRLSVTGIDANHRQAMVTPNWCYLGQPHINFIISPTPISFSSAVASTADITSSGMKTKSLSLSTNSNLRRARATAHTGSTQQ